MDPRITQRHEDAMRYDRVEECKGEFEQYCDPFHALCDDCGGTRKIRTPVDHQEMWAVYGPDGEIVAVQRDEVGARLSAAGRNVNGLKWTADHLKNMKELMESDGYTCEQIDVIRRKA